MKQNTAEINLNIDATYVVKDGRLITADKLPYGFGKQIINWQDYKPVRIDIQFTKKVE